MRGGIRPPPSRGRGDPGWWATKWIDALDDPVIYWEVSKGEKYAGRGQVVLMDIGKGGIRARVRGFGKRPHAVRIRIRKFDKREWERAAAVLNGRHDVAAQMLAGRMPEALEAELRAGGVTLFPGEDGIIGASCSCRHRTTPCRHAAAVYILAAEEVDRDPFLLFLVRGYDRARALELFGLRRDAKRGRAAPSGAPLPDDPIKFWGEGRGTGGGDSVGGAKIPAKLAALPRGLKGFPMWRGEEGLAPAMMDAYRSASRAGADAFSGNAPPGGDGEGQLPDGPGDAPPWDRPPARRRRAAFLAVRPGVSRPRQAGGFWRGLKAIFGAAGR